MQIFFNENRSEKRSAEKILKLKRQKKGNVYKLFSQHKSYMSIFFKKNITVYFRY